jgi:orotidine-5'-phosphate decarboxylase
MPVAESEMVPVKSVNASDRLIFPLDVPTPEQAKEWVDRLDGVVSFFKIGLELYTASGISLVPYLAAKKKKIFLDLKYYDIPETVEGAVKRVAEMGVSFLTIHGNGKIIKAAVKGRGNSDLKLLSVTVLTSLDNDDMKDLGFECTVHDLVLLRAQKALQAGCDGVISSPQEANTIRTMISERTDSMDGRKFLIVTPGIRPWHSSKHDHKRHSTPGAAIKSGADYLVVGRPIREAPHPEKAAREIVSEMQKAFDSLIQ